LPLWKNGSLNWNPSLKNEADELLKQIRDIPEEQFRAAVDAENYLRAQDFQAGVKDYHAHPYERDVQPVKTIWQQGASRLLDYGGPDDGPVVLAVPSLINKSYILDLNKKRSLMRHMAKNGLRCFLLDWGEVGDSEKEFGLEDYIATRLQDCLDEVIRHTDRPVSLIGYCMGGVLTTALNCLCPEKISRLVLMATPWDFHAGDGSHERIIRASRLQLEWTIQTFRELPVDVIQALFACIDPYSILRKFINFTKLDKTSRSAEMFVAMEDWLNDGVPLSGPVAKECLFDWYIKNLPASGHWELDGHRITPSDITCPTLLIVPENDRIVPPDSALALKNDLQNARVMTVQAGHIGMVTGRKAIGSLYTPLTKWLLSNAL
jgi:polyhydroxyalkanoate synthase